MRTTIVLMLSVVTMGFMLSFLKGPTINSEDSGEIYFINEGNNPRTITIWFSDFNNVWEPIHREHLASGESFTLLYQVGQLEYYGYSTDYDRTIYQIFTNYVYLE